MTFDKLPSGIAFTCNERGTIQKVLLDGIGVNGLAQGQRIETLFEAGSQIKLLNFLVELRSKGVAIKWEVNVLTAGMAQPIQLSGVSQKNILMILGSHDNNDALLIFNEFMEMNNEQAMLLRTALNKRSDTQTNFSETLTLYDQMSRLNNELIALQRDLAKKNCELERLNRTIKQLSLTDMLTGLNNRRGFFEKGDQQVSLANRYHHALSMILFDVDNFKMVNDSYGHDIGDQILTGLALRCGDELRETDIFSRYGGDEFAILLPETTASSAFVIAERIRLAVLEPFPFGDRTLSITLSIGIAELNIYTVDMEQLLRCTDRAMYNAKEKGGNCICLYQEEIGV